MATGFRLPAYQVPNQMLNLAPLSAALDSYQGQMNTNAQFGMAQKRESREQEGFDERKKDALRQRLGNLALLTMQENDPARRAEKWGKVMATHPDAASLDPKYHNPETGVLAVLGDANMAQSYLDYQMRKAADARAASAAGRAAAMHVPQLQAAKIQAAAAKRDFETPKPNTFDLGPDHTRFVVRPGPDGTSVALPFAQGGTKNKTEDKFNEAAATSQVKRYDEIITQGANQSSALGTITTLRGLSDKVGAPGVGNTIARTLGPSLRNIGVEVGNLSDMEAFNAIISRLVPAQRPPGSGTMSDKDVELFKASLPQLSATAQGRKLILDQIEAIAVYDKQRAEIASKAINGELPRQQAEIMLRQMPDPMELFRQQSSQRPAGASAGSPQQKPNRGPQPGVVEQGYRFRGGDPSNPQSWEKVQ